MLERTQRVIASIERRAVPALVCDGDDDRVMGARMQLAVERRNLEKKRDLRVDRHLHLLCLRSYRSEHERGTQQETEYATARPPHFRGWRDDPTSESLGFGHESELQVDSKQQR